MPWSRTIAKRLAALLRRPTVLDLLTRERRGYPEMMRHVVGDSRRRNQRTFVIALLITSLVGCGPEAVPGGGSAAEAGPALPEARVAAAAAYVDSLRVAHGMPGISVAVALGDRVVWQYAVGWSDSTRVERVSPSSLFRIGSVSKLITAAAAVRLSERGALDLDRPISEFIPMVPRTDVPMTPRMLAGHLGGIRHYADGEYVSQIAYPNVGASLWRFLDDPLVATPGTRYAYSSYGYNLLGSVLEQATGTEFRTVVREEVTAPLGLEGIMPSEAGSLPQEVNYFSRTDSGELDEAPFVDLSDRWPSGGYISSAGDLARFGSMIFRALSESARRTMLTPMETVEGTSTDVGVGWRIGVDSRGRRIAHHGGTAMGSRAFLLAYPERDLAVAVLANLTFAPVGEAEAVRIAELLGW